MLGGVANYRFAAFCGSAKGIVDHRVSTSAVLRSIGGMPSIQVIWPLFQD